MRPPTIKTVQQIGDSELLIEFSNHEYRKYEVATLFDKTMFSPLKDPLVFKSFQVEPGGYAISWNNDIDISENELWVHGEPVTHLA